MYDPANLIERLDEILVVLKRIPSRFAGIEAAADFQQNEAGQDRLDAICMSLVAVGEAFRQIDAKTEGRLLERYPEVDWRGVIGVPNVIAHGYFDIDVEQVYAICQHDIATLISVVQKMTADLR